MKSISLLYAVDGRLRSAKSKQSSGPKTLDNVFHLAESLVPYASPRALVVKTQEHQFSIALK